MPTFGAPLDAVSLRRRIRGHTAVGARAPSHPGTTIIGEGHLWRKTSLNSPFQSNPISTERNRLTKGADLGALPVAPWAPGVSGGSLLAAPGRGCALALGGMLVSGGRLWFNLGKVVMASPSFSEMISREGGGTPAPVAPWLPSGAALGSRGGIFERC